MPFALSVGKRYFYSEGAKTKIKNERVVVVVVRISEIVLLLLTLVGVYYVGLSFLGLIFDCLDLFQALFLKIALALGGRALASALFQFGLPGGLALAIGLAFRALLTSEEIPLRVFPDSGDFISKGVTSSSSNSSTLSVSRIEKWLDPEGSSADPNEVDQPRGAPEASTSSRAHQPAAPAPYEEPLWQIQHQRIKNRIATLTPERKVSDDEIDSIIMLKGGIVDHMAQLDPHQFWTEQRHNLITDGILNKGAEYTMETLEHHFLLLTTDGEGRGSDSFFF